MAEGLPNYRDPNGDRALAQRIREIEDSIAALRRGLGVGLVVDGRTGDLHVAGSRNIRLGSKDGKSGAVTTSSFDGTDFADPGTQGNYFGDDGIVLNDAYFRPGSVGNDALTDPLEPIEIDDSTDTFAITTVNFTTNVVPTILTKTYPAPAGFTRAIVAASSWGTGVNPNTTGGNNGAGGDYLLSRVDINGAISTAYPTGVSGSNGQNTASSGRAKIVTVAPGGSVIVKAQLGSGFQNFGAPNSSNGINLAGTVIWLR